MTNGSILYNNEYIAGLVNVNISFIPVGNLVLALIPDFKNPQPALIPTVIYLVHVSVPIVGIP